MSAMRARESKDEAGEMGGQIMPPHPNPAASARSDTPVRPRILHPLPPKIRTTKASKDRRSGGKNRVAPEQELSRSRTGLATQADEPFITAKAQEQRAGNGGPGPGAGARAGGEVQEHGRGVSELVTKQRGSVEESMVMPAEEDVSLDRLASKQGEGGSNQKEGSWDLCLIVDSDQSTEEAQKEIKKLFKLLKKEGLKLSEPVPLDASGWEGRVLSLATATQAEFEEEAEIMGLSKPLKLNPAVASRFRMHHDYGRVTAPFTVHKRSHFHPSPFVIRDRVLQRGSGGGMDNSGLDFFSPCERQFLLEHMTENKIRQLMRSKQLSAHTSVTFFPLHETIGEAGKSLQGLKVLEFLQQRWATPWRKERYLSVLKIWENPHNGTDEPLDEIRSYFGEQIAMYAAFLSFYTRWLSYPALVGLGLQIWSWYHGFDNMGLVVCCAFICFWSALFIKFWERRQSALAYYWFTSDLNLEEKVRREFYLAMDKFEKDRKASRKVTDGDKKVTERENDLNNSDLNDAEEEELQRENEMKAENFKFPLAWRARAGAVSVSVIGVLLTCVVIIFVYMYLINVVAAYTNCEYGIIAGSIVHACLIIGMGWVYRTLAVKLNDRENHRTEEEYENHFILKIFLFEFVNNFLSMIWIAFLSFRYCSSLEEASALLPGTKNKICLLDGIEECEEEFRDKVIMELQTKLGSLFLTRLVVSNIIETGVITRVAAKLQASLRACCACCSPGVDLYARDAAHGSGFFRTGTAMVESEEEVGSRKWWIEKGKLEAAWPDYGEGGSARTVDDYNEIVMQFCFVNLFGVAFPITGLLALISNLVELVVDSRKLCFHTRRPFAQRAASIPDMWTKILKCVALFGVVTNIVIVLTNSSAVTDFLNISQEDGAQLWTAMFVFEHLLVALIVIFWQITSSEPRNIKKLKVLSRRIQRALLLSNMSLDSGEGHGSLFHMHSSPTSPTARQAGPP